VVVAAAAAAGSCTGSAAASPGLAPGDKYVALGSSYAAGPGLPIVYDLGCDHSNGNYAHQVASRLQLALTDVTCSGATTANITTTPQTTPTGVRPVQLDAVTPDTKLVTVTVGGNDVDYTGPGAAGSLWAYGCTDTHDVPPAGAWTPYACGHTVDPAEIEQKLKAEPQVLTDLFRQIRAKAPKARVLLVTYQRVIPPSGATCAAIALTAAHARFERDVGQRLQVAFQRAAARSRTELVDLYAPSIHHAACATRKAWVSAWTWGSFPTGTIAFHPTVDGMTAATDAILHGLAKAAIAIAGISRAGCTRASSTTLRVRVTSFLRVRGTTVRLDGRRIAHGRRASLRVHLALSGLRAGRHTLTVTASTAAGITTRTWHFRICVVPAFTG
jgi:hypothetical protein